MAKYVMLVSFLLAYDFLWSFEDQSQWRTFENKKYYYQIEIPQCWDASVALDAEGSAPENAAEVNLLAGSKCSSIAKVESAPVGINIAKVNYTKDKTSKSYQETEKNLLCRIA